MEGDRARRLLARLEPLDRIGLAFLLLGGLAVATGVLPAAEAGHTLARILPLLVFLGTVVVLAELTSRAEIFDVVAARLAILARGRYPALFAGCVAFATATTAALNLDTTAVLLTPVVLALARKIGSRRLPLAMTTVWLANTASLLLPVSNLTNLLAADRVGLGPLAFAARMALPEAASVLVTAACLWVFHWRRGLRDADRYTVPAPHVPADRVLFGVAAAACAVFVVLVLAGVELALAAAVCAGVVVLVVAVRDRAALSWGLLPWRLLVTVTGLFLVVDAVTRHGLGAALGRVAGGPGAEGVVRATAAGAVLANALNNLPAYVAVESVIPPDRTDALLGLLVGVNVGPIVAPWASVATLLWYERCRADGLRIAWRPFVLTGAVTAVTAMAAATGALLLTS